MIRKIWKRYNVSTILILPIFNDITDNILYKTEKGKILDIKFPFNQLCIEYGLLNTFLYRNNKRQFNGKFYLVFDKKKVNKNMEMTNSTYHSITELIIDSDYFETMYIKNDVIVFVLTIDEKIHNDIKLIEQNKYSKVSNRYKNLVKIKQKRIPMKQGVTNIYGSYINRNDLGYAICMKAVHIRKEIENFLQNSVNKEKEFFVEFVKHKEVLSIF